MRSRFALLLANVLPVNGLLHYYVGLWGWQWLHQIAPHLSGWAFWIPFAKTFEIDWGYLHKGATHVIVSLGLGTWEPPVRIGNTPEIVHIRVRFA